MKSHGTFDLFEDGSGKLYLVPHKVRGEDYNAAMIIENGIVTKSRFSEVGPRLTVASTNPADGILLGRFATILEASTSDITTFEYTSNGLVNLQIKGEDRYLVMMVTRDDDS